MKHFRAWAIYFAWIISLMATMGSLYYGEILGIEPCPMCWYQRICMFPLAIILGIAAYRLDYTIKLYTLAQIVVGAVIAFWQFLEQKIPSLAPPALCSWQGDCTNEAYEMIGLSFPLLSFIAFVLIFFFLITIRQEQ